jgi:hypothetical protein
VANLFNKTDIASSLLNYFLGFWGERFLLWSSRNC